MCAMQSVNPCKQVQCKVVVLALCLEGKSWSCNEIAAGQQKGCICPLVPVLLTICRLMKAVAFASAICPALLTTQEDSTKFAAIQKFT